MKAFVGWLKSDGRLNILLLGAVLLLINPLVQFASSMVGKTVFGFLIVVAVVLLYRANRRTS